jgi:hypothetical protein
LKPTHIIILALCLTGGCVKAGTPGDDGSELGASGQDIASADTLGAEDTAATLTELPRTEDVSVDDIVAPPTDAQAPADTHPMVDTDNPMDATQPTDAGPSDSEVPVDDVSMPEDAAAQDTCAAANCPAVATCVNGVCVCDSGYESDGNNGCQDVNECEQGVANCDPAAECINTEGGFTCGSCPAPYADPNGDGTLCVLGYNACGVGRFSDKASGTFQAPLVAPYLPMVDHNSTASAASDTVDTYDCAPGKLETGPEVFYRFVTTEPGTFHAELTDPQGVDIDIHLLQNPALEGSQMTGCIARAHEKLTVENLPPGEYWVVADTWSDGTTEFTGDFNLAFEWTAVGVWNEVPIDQGITWSRLRLVLPEGDQTINKVRVDMSHGWDVQPEEHPGCKTVAATQKNLGALVGVNGTFYSGNCSSLGLLRADGVTYTTNTMTGYEQRTIGWNATQTPSLSWLNPNQDWTEVTDAIGGYPSLVTDGVGIAEAVPGSQVWSEVDWQKHPRTLAAIDAEGHLVLMTLDGRTSAGDGMTTPALATYLEQQGFIQAVNLDGGGSTTMTVHDCWLNHVVSYPSDNKKPDHYGGRSVGNGLYVR